MTVEPAIFTCSICGEPSTELCVYCTKDACGNHRCDRCKRCSDCCECDVPLSAAEVHPEPEPHMALPAPPPEIEPILEIEPEGVLEIEPGGVSDIEPEGEVPIFEP
jgi:hypothetical protein